MIFSQLMFILAGTLTVVGCLIIYLMKKHGKNLIVSDVQLNKDTKYSGDYAVHPKYMTIASQLKTIDYMDKKGYDMISESIFYLVFKRKKI